METIQLPKILQLSSGNMVLLEKWCGFQSMDIFEQFHYDHEEDMLYYRRIGEWRESALDVRNYLDLKKSLVNRVRVLVRRTQLKKSPLSE